MKWMCIPVLLIGFAACNNQEGPDVSGVPVNMKVHRFEQFLFENLDTNNIQSGLEAMKGSYPFFANDFIINILGLPYGPVSNTDTTGEIVSRELKRFIRLTSPLYDSLAPRFKETNKMENELRRGFQHVKYYFPAYQVPEVVTYIGPFDAPAVAVTTSALAIGLQLYAGKNFSFYTSMQGQELYPAYISRRFEPEYITVNAMTAVVEDIYPFQVVGKPMIEQMIMKGKQWWLLDKFLPGVSDTLKTGYTSKQAAWCEGNEGVVWNFFLQNNDLYTTEPMIVKNFIGEAPGTDGMPAQAPGNIGQWIGWQIVEAYAATHPEMTPDAVMKVDPKIILKESKYKPR